MKVKNTQVSRILYHRLKRDYIKEDLIESYKRIVKG